MNETPTPARLPRLLVAVIAALALLVAACGDDDTTAADDGPTTTVDDDMADDDMADTPDDVATIWSELVDAGLSDTQADCVTDAVVAEWGADALSQTGRISDEDLLRLRDIVFDCA